MDEAERGGVQRLAVKIQPFQYLAMRRPGPAIDRVAEQGMADRGHVDPDLVGAPGFEPAFHQRGVPERLRRFGSGSPPSCRAPPRRSRSSCGSPTSGRAGRRSSPPAGSARPRRSPDSAARCCAGRIAPPAPHGRRRSWRRPAAPTCPCRSGGRSPAAPPRRCRSSRPAQWWSRALTRVPSKLPAAGMDDHPGRLVDDQQMLVLEDDVERDVLRLVMRRPGLGHGDFVGARRPP